ncbi:MAG TPA: hypothetical protein VGD60_10970 [Candidatus Acidoferrales bacterium]
MKIRSAVSAAIAVLAAGILATPAGAQSGSGAGTGQTSTTQTQTQVTVQTTPRHVMPGQTTYHPPTHTERFKSFAFDSFGPYAFFGAAVGGAIQQADNAPPEWGDGVYPHRSSGGFGAYGDRFASTFGINLTTQMTRYGLSELFREDTSYYRCECDGFVPRLKHALISTVTARKGEDGHRVFSIPNLVAPYAGGQAAADLWYPSRYGPKDGFRFGNYNLGVQAGLNVALEFIYGGPHTLLSRHHVPIVSGMTGSDNKQ